MSDESEPEPEPESEPEPDSEPEPEPPLDQLGIPMSREPTIDDVRSDGREHRQLAVGCSVAVALLLGAFWLFRVALG